MYLLKSYRSLFIISFLIILLDQVWKYMMLTVLIHDCQVPIINGFFSLTLVFNTGAAFGILQGKKIIFLVLPVITVVFVLFFYSKYKKKEELVLPFALLLGGTVGNFIDRIRYGYVIDFFDLFFKKWHWPVFNIADACICFGVFLILLQLLKDKEGRV